MAYTEKEKELISTLLEKVELVEEILSSKGINVSDNYRYIVKVKNILKNKDEKGMKNVSHHLFMDFRQIIDFQIDVGILSDMMDEVFLFTENNKLFNK